MILHTLLDYDVLRVIWWVLLGVLLVAFAVTDGFDLGTGFPRKIARAEAERRAACRRNWPGVRSRHTYCNRNSYGVTCTGYCNSNINYTSNTCARPVSKC